MKLGARATILFSSSLEYARELHIIALRRKKQSTAPCDMALFQ
jgi:hypothetical protein